MEINERVQYLAERLQKDERLQAYILIDPALREPIEPDLLLREECAEVRIPIRWQGLQPHQYPRLVVWRPQAVGVLRSSLEAAVREQESPDLEAAEGIAIGGWLLSSSTATEVASHLATVMSALQPGVGARYLRWADRRMQEWMWPLLTASQRQSLLGPIQSWLSIDRRAAWVEYEPGQLTEKLALRLDSGQWHHAMQCEVGQHLMRGWARFSNPLPVGYLAAAAGAVKSIQSLGVTGIQDVVLLGAYVLQVHPRLCTHPKVRELVLQSQTKGAGLASALARIPDPEGWDAIRRDLELRSRTTVAA